MEKVRLTGFRAEKIAPNFFNFLSKRGSVEVGEEIIDANRGGLSRSVDFHKGIGKQILLNGKQVGVMEVYINPSAVVFVGEIPYASIEKRRGRSIKPQTRIDTDGMPYSEVMIVYQWEDSLAYSSGKRGWKEIPFP